jgi:hypothetical protein
VIWKEPKGVKHKNGKVWDPTTNRTKALRENANQAVEKQRAKDETDGKWSVTGKNPIIQRFE